jgi:uncharacterized membrane protein YhfC
MIHYGLLILNALIMIGLPFLLGWTISRKRQMTWGLFAIGGATFVMSQVGHIPFNLAVLPAIQRVAAGLPEQGELILVAAFLGLSAGVFEEGARFLVFRHWVTGARSWGTGLMLGAGHGGTEAIILGLLALLNASFFVAFDLDYLSFPAEQQASVRMALDAVAASPWYMLLLGAAERVSALMLHLSLSLLVMRGFLPGRRPLFWLALAVLWHAAVDATAVMALNQLSALVTEAIIAVFGLLSVILVFHFRAPEPVEPEPPPLPEVGPARPIDLPLSQERIDDSRYFS